MDFYLLDSATQSLNNRDQWFKNLAEILHFNNQKYRSMLCQAKPSSFLYVGDR